MILVLYIEIGAKPYKCTHDTKFYNIMAAQIYFLYKTFKKSSNFQIIKIFLLNFSSQRIYQTIYREGVYKIQLNTNDYLGIKAGCTI